jgi:hypothetical protein
LGFHRLNQLGQSLLGIGEAAGEAHGYWAFTA